jgi:hypothetical protein
MIYYANLIKIFFLNMYIKFEFLFLILIKNIFES